MTQKVTITRPDDLHLHVRDGAMLKTVIGHSAREFARATIMPNLKPPVTTVSRAIAYREMILDALPVESVFNPLMTLYLTDTLAPSEVQEGYDTGMIKAVKLYPAGATTNSDAGVTSFDAIMPTLEKMAELQMPLLIHGESTDPAVDVFDREKVFIEQTLTPLRARIPDLKIVMEHITTHDAVQYVSEAGENLAASITAHHLLMNRNDIFQGGINPHHYCLPVLKRERHRESLVEAATSGSWKFFAGTDSAPHPKGAKECPCGCAGMYTAFAALPLYAEAFDKASALDKLEGFTSFYGADYYGLPRNSGTITLVKEEWVAPQSYEVEGDVLVPLRAGEKVAWKVI